MDAKLERVWARTRGAAADHRGPSRRRATACAGCRTRSLKPSSKPTLPAAGARGIRRRGRRSNHLLRPCRGGLFLRRLGRLELCNWSHRRGRAGRACAQTAARGIRQPGVRCGRWRLPDRTGHRRGRRLPRDRPMGLGQRHPSREWALAYCPVFDGERLRTAANGAPVVAGFLMPKEKCAILDAWHVGGMRGTGSTEFEVHDVFVPEEFVLRLLSGESRHPYPFSACRHVLWLQPLLRAGRNRPLRAGRAQDARGDQDLGDDRTQPAR